MHGLVQTAIELAPTFMFCPPQAVEPVAVNVGVGFTVTFVVVKFLHPFKSVTVTV